MQWADDSFQEQEVLHMYGPLTRKRPLRIGDHVIALADPSKQLYVPYVAASLLIFCICHEQRLVRVCLE